MNKLIFLLSFIMIISAGSFAQHLNKTVSDFKSKDTILVGHCNREGLKTGTFSPYYLNEYDNYGPDSVITGWLSVMLNEFDITIVLGTWCGDSKEQVPRFYKILDQAGYDENRLKLICVDRDKKAADINLDSLRILLVPTFIIYYNNKEIGRIIETPVQSLENDLFGIISNKKD